MSRAKGSSNRIELSQLVQDLLNFGDLDSLQLLRVGEWVDGVRGGWGSGWMGWGWLRVPPHMCICMHAHACVVNMIISCKWPPPLGESLGIPHDVICMCVCMPMHVHVWGHPLTTPTPILPVPPQGGPLESVKIQQHLN